MLLPAAAALASGGGAGSPAEGRDRAFGAAAAAALAAGLLLTQSRAAWLGAAAGLGVWAAISGRVPRRLLLAAAAAGAAALLGLGILWTRRSATADWARVELWRSAGAVAARHPAAGVGVGAFGNAFRSERTEGFIRALGGGASQATAHNDLLEAAATMGLPGLAAYLWLLGAVVAAARRAAADPARRDGAAAAAGGLAALFVLAKFDPTPLAALVLAAILLGLLAPPAAPAGTPSPDRAANPLLRLGAAVAASAALVVSVRLARADHWFLRGRVYRDVGRVDLAPTSFDMALRLNPYETKFRMATVAFLLDLSARVSGREKADLLAAARRVSSEGLARRPGHVDSWQTEGVLLARIAKEGDASAWAPAAAALDRALTLDPWFPALLAARAAVAEGSGDAAGLAHWRGRQRRLAELYSR